MAITRLGTVTPAANTLTSLALASVSGVSSVTVTNKTQVSATVTIYVKPFDSGPNPVEWSYLTANLPITGGQTFETFRFGLAVNDEVFVEATTSDISFTLNTIYELEGRSNVTVGAVQPGFPQVGDFWLNTGTDQLQIWSGSDWAYIAESVPVGPIGPTGPQGPIGADGPEGPTGPTGPQAVSFNLLGQVADVASLPAVDNTLDDAYYVQADGEVYIWTVNGWVSVGPITGPTGPQGPAGADGVDGADGDATAYTPTTASDWDVTPTTIAGALDELAARLRILETP